MAYLYTGTELCFSMMVLKLFKDTFISVECVCSFAYSFVYFLIASLYLLKIDL